MVGHLRYDSHVLAELWSVCVAKAPEAWWIISAMVRKFRCVEDSSRDFSQLLTSCLWAIAACMVTQARSGPAQQCVVRPKTF